ncbi:hypothetical protein INR49_005054 [Caranx melampygus]|nr:hypothetical protein INR49_005054 [Caranx melampygus]
MDKKEHTGTVLNGAAGRALTPPDLSCCCCCCCRGTNHSDDTHCQEALLSSLTPPPHPTPPNPFSFLPVAPFPL